MFKTLINQHFTDRYCKFFVIMKESIETLFLWPDNFDSLQTFNKRKLTPFLKFLFIWGGIFLPRDDFKDSFYFASFSVQNLLQLIWVLFVFCFIFCYMSSSSVGKERWIYFLLFVLICLLFLLLSLFYLFFFRFILTFLRSRWLRSRCSSLFSSVLCESVVIVFNEHFKKMFLNLLYSRIISIAAHYYEVKLS